MRVPVEWLQRVRRPRPAGRRARGAPDHDRDQGRGRPPPRRRRARALRHRQGARAPSQHPDADRLQRVHGRRGRRRPAADRVRRAQRRGRPDRGRRAPGRRDARRDEARRGQAARRGVQRDDPGRGRARDRHRPRGHHGARRRRSSRARRCAGVLPIATDVLELEITPNRPDCLAVYGVAREVHAATGAPLAPPPWAEDLGTAGDDRRASRSSSRRPTCARASPPALFEDVTIGPSPPWLKARLMAAGQRPINNVVDITNYVMLLAGQPAARLRPRPRRRRAARRAPRARRRAGDHARRPGPHARRPDARHRRRRRADVDRRRHGRRALRGPRGDHARADGGRQLGRPQHPPHVAGAGPAQRGQRALREGPRARAGDGGADRRHAAHARADRRAPRARDDRRRRRQARPRRRHPPARASRRGAPRASRSRARARPRSCARWASSAAEAPDGLDVPVPAFRRNDVTREADLVEEVARMDGLEKLPATLPKRRGSAGRLSVRAAPAPPRDRRARRAAACMRSWAGASPSPGSPIGCAWPPTTRAGASWPSRTR